MSWLAADDWLEAGLSALAREGARALTIDNLANGLHVTKGSFYHHFSSTEEFKLRVLAYWERRLTFDIVAEVEAVSQPEDFLDRFVDTLTRNPPDAERAIRAWALDDDEVRQHLERVDVMRVERAAAWFRLGTSEAESRVVARSMYALLVGCYSIVPPVADAELKGIMAEFFRRYGATPHQSQTSKG